MLKDRDLGQGYKKLTQSTIEGIQELIRYEDWALGFSENMRKMCEIGARRKTSGKPMEEFLTILESYKHYSQSYIELCYLKGLKVMAKAKSKKLNKAKQHLTKLSRNKKLQKNPINLKG